MSLTDFKEKNIFATLFQRKVTSVLKVLIELSFPLHKSWYFTNDNIDITWKGRTYTAVPMSYKPPSSNNGIPSGGSFEIDLDQQQLSKDGQYYDELLAWFDEADDKAELTVNAIMNDKGEITELGWLKHRFGSLNWDGKKIVWNPGTDNRLQMQVNPWNADTDFLLG
jgi:hypothetical protein